MKKSFIPILWAAGLSLLMGCSSKSKNEPQRLPSPNPQIETAKEGAADTVGEAASIQDEDAFTLVEKEYYYRSVEKEEMYDGTLMPYYSHTIVSIQWPLQLEGCSHVKALQDGLMEHTLGKESVGMDLMKAIEKRISTPLFLESVENQKYEVISEKEFEGGPTTFDDSFNAKVSMDSPTLMTYVFNHSTYSGGAHGMYAIEYMHFDKTKGIVYTADNAFLKGKKGDLLRLINKYIRKKGEEYSEANRIPTFALDEKNVVFTFTPYEIAAYCFGAVEIKIPFNEVSPFMQPDFKKHLQHAAEFQFFNQEESDV